MFAAKRNSNWRSAFWLHTHSHRVARDQMIRWEQSGDKQVLSLCSFRSRIVSVRCTREYTVEGGGKGKVK